MSATVTTDRAIDGEGCVLEVLGVAGAGKSTIARTLIRATADLVDGTHVARHHYWFHAQVGAVRHWSSARGHRSDGWLRRWTDAKNYAYLDAFRRVVLDERAARGHAIVFDHGPLYRLAQLRRGANAAADDAIGPPRWQTPLRYWSETLDLAIVLDAPDDVLIDRVLARSNHHRMKDMPRPEARRFVEEARGSLLHVGRQVAALGHSRLLMFDTSQYTVDDITSAVLSAWRSLRQRSQTCEEAA